MLDVANDLGAKLDWVAVDHWNTDNPHVHVLIRGRGDDGRNLVISREYISRGFRNRAAKRVTFELGPRGEQGIRTALEREVALVLLLIIPLDNPFRGHNHVSAAPFEHLVEIVENIAYPKD